MLVIVGWSSQIASELRNLLDSDHEADADIVRGQFGSLPLDADRYFFCAGVLVGKPVVDFSVSEINSTLYVNFAHVISSCERIFQRNDKARICIMGSESGNSGSYDRFYAGSKAALHHYIETRAVNSRQQLVGIAPSIIGDAGMTTRRQDYGVLEQRLKHHPKRRFLTSREVALLVRFLLYEDDGYICNTVIRMNGGEHATR